MSIDYLSAIRTESARLADIVSEGPLDAPIAGCPGWNLGDLAIHMVDVQRWATHIVRTRQVGEHGVSSPAPAAAASALRASSEEIVQALAAADPQEPCWNFTGAPQVMSFWFRRQAAEVAVHRWDAEAAVSSSPTPIEAELAAHTIDEFVHLILQRTIERDNIDVSKITSDVHVHCTGLDDIDAPGEWTFEIIDGALVVTDEHRKSAVALRGPASNLALALYGRMGRDDVEVFGSAESLDQWSALLTL